MVDFVCDRAVPLAAAVAAFHAAAFDVEVMVREERFDGVGVVPTSEGASPSPPLSPASSPPLTCSSISSLDASIGMGPPGDRSSVPLAVESELVSSLLVVVVVPACGIGFEPGWLTGATGVPTADAVEAATGLERRCGCGTGN